MTSFSLLNSFGTHYSLENPAAGLTTKIVAAEDALARLDELLRTSPIRDGFIARTHFADACASLLLEGELVDPTELVLHDAGMDVRAPTHELTRAHAVLRTRRRLLRENPSWVFSTSGLDFLRERPETPLESATAALVAREADEDDPRAGQSSYAADDLLANAFAALDAASGKALAAIEQPRRRDPMVYADDDFDEENRFQDWKRFTRSTEELPPTFAAALAIEAWHDIRPMERSPWLGPILGAALLRERGKARHHLPHLSRGFAALPQKDRRAACEPVERLALWLRAIEADADAGRKDHDRWLNSRAALERRLVGKRGNSKLRALREFALSRPIVSASTIAKELKVTPRGAQDLVAELGLREITGRARYRAWAMV